MSDVDQPADDPRPDEPEAQASETSQNPNSSEDHSTNSAPSRDRCVAQVAAADR